MLSDGNKGDLWNQNNKAVVLCVAHAYLTCFMFAIDHKSYFAFSLHRYKGLKPSAVVQGSKSVCFSDDITHFYDKCSDILLECSH